MALTDIRNALILSPSLGTSGQPTREQFAEIAAAGYEVVVNLALPTSPGAVPDEAEYVASLGMVYIGIPVVWEAPTADDLAQFFAVMEANSDRRLFLHCAANMRVSAFLFLYRVIRLGMPEETAETDLHKLWRPTGWWEVFIEDSLAAAGF